MDLTIDTRDFILQLELIKCFPKAPLRATVFIILKIPNLQIE